MLPAGYHVARREVRCFPAGPSTMSHPPVFIVSVKDFDEGPKKYSFPVGSSWLTSALSDSEAKPDVAAADGTFDVTLSKSGRDVVVRGRVRTRVRVPCARCLELGPVPIDAEVTALLVPTAALRVAEEEHEMSADEADVVPFDGETVILDDLVHDELLLAIPMIHLCSESCPGISPATFVLGDRGSAEPRSIAGEIDPRLEPLRRLRSKLSKE